MEQGEKTPMITTYVGRKVSDGNYGSFDVGSWFSLPFGADQEMIEQAQAQADAMIAIQKPHVLAKTKAKPDAQI